jgi:hypothetical protein
MEGMYESRKVRLTTFWEERRVIFICFLIGFAQFQYGYDSAAVSGFQSMAGFLRIFGYPDVGWYRERTFPLFTPLFICNMTIYYTCFSTTVPAPLLI